MISYHPAKPNGHNASVFTRGFKAVDTENSVYRFASCMRRFVWSPCIWKSGIRREANFLGAAWAVLDYDNGELTLEDAMRKFCDMEHVIGTTKSHRKEKNGVVCDRFRVAIRFDKPITKIRVFRFNMWQLLKRQDEADQACKDGARFFYPCTKIVSLGCDGLLEEVTEEVPQWFEHHTPPSVIRDRMQPDSWTKKQLSSVIPRGKRNTAIYGIAKDLTFVGLTESEILAVILKSPTYVSMAIDADLLREITGTMRSGIKRAEVELKTEGQNL